MIVYKMPELMNREGRQMFNFPGVYDRTLQRVAEPVPEPPKETPKDAEKPARKPRAKKEPEPESSEAPKKKTLKFNKPKVQ
jgi:hypothetical protein